MSAAQIVGQGLAADKKLPADLQITANNPIFGDSAEQDYANKYFQTAIQPMIDSQRIQNSLTGNQDSTYGATALTNLGVQGANQAFFSGEDFRNRRVSELLNRRQSFFGNDAAIASAQDALGVQTDEDKENELTNRYGIGANYNLGAANMIGGLYQNSNNNDRADAAAKAQAQQQGIAGLFGLGGGLLGLGGSLFNGGGGSSSQSFMPPSTPLTSGNGINIGSGVTMQGFLPTY